MDQEVKENGTCGSHFIIKKKTTEKNREETMRESRERECMIFLFFYFFSYLSLRYTEIEPSEFVGARTKRLYSTRATRGNQKHGISQSFQLKFEKSSILVFFQIYDFLSIRIGRSRRSN